MDCKIRKEKLYEGLPDFVIQKIENGNFISAKESLKAHTKQSKKKIADHQQSFLINSQKCAYLVFLPQ